MERSQVDRAPVVLTTTPLAASATEYYPTKNGEVRTASTMLVAYVRATAWSDVAGTLTLEESDNDGTTWATTGSALTVSASTIAVFPTTALTKKAWRWKYVNGGTIQAKFSLLEDRMPASANVNVTGSNVEGTPGTAAPSKAEQIAGADTSGLLRVPLVDLLGNADNWSPATLRAMLVGAMMMGFDGTYEQRLRTAASNGQFAGTGVLATAMGLHSGTSDYRGQAAVYNIGDAGTGIQVGAVHEVLFNNTNYDRKRGNTSGTLLASAARTATTTGVVQTNYNARGVLLILHVTAASGTGGLQAQVWGVDPIDAGDIMMLNSAPTAILATGRYGYLIYPGASATGVAGAGNTQQFTPAALSREWGLRVLHGDASSYTYSIGYALIV